MAEIWQTGGSDALQGGRNGRFKILSFMPVPYNTGFLTICTDWPVKQVVWVAEIWQNSGADALDANVVYFGP